MTKKLFSLAIALILMTGFMALASAEQGASVYGGKKYFEQQVFVSAWNPGSGTIGKNCLVVIGTTGTLGDSAGATVAVTSTAKNPAVFGIADEEISSDDVGRICIRGPHLVRVLTPTGTAQLSFAAGIVMTPSASLGQAQGYLTSSNSVGYDGVVGITMTGSTAGAGAAYNDYSTWIWVQPQRV